MNASAIFGGISLVLWAVVIWAVVWFCRQLLQKLDAITSEVQALRHQVTGPQHIPPRNTTPPPSTAPPYSGYQPPSQA